MRYEPHPGAYRTPQETEQCREMFHPKLGIPFCTKDLEHEGGHKGFNFSWIEEPQVDEETARRFITAYRRIPNGIEGITLNDDSTVTMTLCGLEAAVRFVRVSNGD